MGKAKKPAAKLPPLKVSTHALRADLRSFLDAVMIDRRAVEITRYGRTVARIEPVARRRVTR